MVGVVSERRHGVEKQLAGAAALHMAVGIVGGNSETMPDGRGLCGLTHWSVGNVLMVVVRVVLGGCCVSDIRYGARVMFADISTHMVMVLPLLVVPMAPVMAAGYHVRLVMWLLRVVRSLWSWSWAWWWVHW